MRDYIVIILKGSGFVIRNIHGKLVKIILITSDLITETKHARQDF